jgi:hypothetical protein
MQIQKTASFIFEGVPYETEEELLCAQLLAFMQVRSLHHVSFPVDGHSVSPDFIFGSFFIWDGGRGDPLNRQLFLGIEVKLSHAGRCKCRSQYERLVALHRVPILILTRDEIVKWHGRKRLPIIPVATSGEKVAYSAAS